MLDIAFTCLLKVFKIKIFGIFICNTPVPRWIKNLRTMSCRDHAWTLSVQVSNK